MKRMISLARAYPSNRQIKTTKQHTKFTFCCFKGQTRKKKKHSCLTWCSLSCKDNHTGHGALALVGGHCLEVQVAAAARQDVEELALVLVNALDLDVKQRVGIDLHTQCLADVLGKTLNRTISKQNNTNNHVETCTKRLHQILAKDWGES